MTKKMSAKLAGEKKGGREANKELNKKDKDRLSFSKKKGADKK